MTIHRYWRQPEYLECRNCNSRYSATGLRASDYEHPTPCQKCGFDVYPVWGDRDRDARRESHTEWNQPKSFVCDNCGATYSPVGTRDDHHITCVRCYADVYPRH